MVLRPGSLVDFTLKSKDSALTFVQSLKNLDSNRSATAYTDSMVEVRRIDFIPPGFLRHASNKIMVILLELLKEFRTDITSRLEPEFLK